MVYFLSPPNEIVLIQAAILIPLGEEKWWIKNQTDPLPKLRKKLVKVHFNRIDDILIRIGYIEKTPDTIGQAHIISTWFSIPSSHQQRETKIQWVELTKEQRKQFDRREWLA
jgi:hypothetical protein